MSGGHAPTAAGTPAAHARSTPQKWDDQRDSVTPCRTGTYNELFVGQGASPATRSQRYGAV
jgi:hypothetical protein